MSCYVKYKFNIKIWKNYSMLLRDLDVMLNYHQTSKNIQVKMKILVAKICYFQSIL